MPVPPTSGCPDPSGHTSHIANKVYDDLDRVADRLAYLAAHEVDYAREVADDLAAQLCILVNRLDAEPPRLFGYDACTDPDLGDGYYAQQQREALRNQCLAGAPDSTTEHDSACGAPDASAVRVADDDPVGFALTHAATRLLDAHRAAPHVISRADDPQLHVHHVSGRPGRGRPIR